MSVPLSLIIVVAIVTAAASVRRPDQVLVATSVRVLHKLRWCRNIIPTHPFTNAAVASEFWPPFELIINFAEVREGSYPNEPHLLFPPVLS